MRRDVHPMSTFVLTTTMAMITGFCSLTYADDAWPHGNANVRGMCYAPLPSWTQYQKGITNGPYYGADVYGEQWSRLWGDGFTTFSADCIDANGTQARNDIAQMSSHGVNVIRTYAWASCYQGCEGAPWFDAQASYGGGHQRFLDYCSKHDIKVMVQIPSEYANSFNATVAENIVNSCMKMADTGQLIQPPTLHEAVHSFIVGNEPDISGVPNAVENSVKLANHLMQTFQSQPGFHCTIPLTTSNVVGFGNAVLHGVDAPGYPMNGTRIEPQYVQNSNTGSSPGFFMSYQAFQTGDGYKVVVLDPYKNGVSSPKPPMIMSEFGFTAWDTTDKENRQLQGQILGDTVESVCNVIKDPSYACKGFNMFQWQDSQWKRAGVVQGNPSINGTATSENYFGLNQIVTPSQPGTLPSYQVNGGVNLCGGSGSWSAPFTVEIDHLIPIPYSGSQTALERIASVWNPSLLGDVDENGSVDKQDLDLLHEMLGYRLTDVDHSGGTIDIEDLLKVIEDWGQSSGP